MSTIDLDPDDILLGEDNNIIKDVDLSEFEEEIKSMNNEEDIELAKSVKIKNEKITQTDVKQMTDKELIQHVDKSSDEVKKLYEEFNSFLEQKTDDKKDDSLNKLTIPTGIDLLDTILGGGFAVGALNVIVGMPGSGKSMILGKLISNAQKIYNGDIVTIYLDSEESTTNERLFRLGVQHPRITPKHDVTVEFLFKNLETLCLFKDKEKIIDRPSLVCWDSIANTLSEKERETDDPNSVIGYRARMFSILIPRYVAKCSKYNICFMAVNQLRDVLSIGPMGGPRDLKFLSSTKQVPGGQTLKFNTFQMVELKTKGITEIDKQGFNGIINSAKCVKNKLFPCNIEIKIIGNFVRGFSNFWSNYEFLKETKRLNTGAWNYLSNLPDKKFRTKDVTELYKDDKVFKEAYDKEVKDAIKSEIIERNQINAEYEEFL